MNTFYSCRSKTMELINRISKGQNLIPRTRKVISKVQFALTKLQDINICELFKTNIQDLTYLFLELSLSSVSIGWLTYKQLFKTKETKNFKFQENRHVASKQVDRFSVPLDQEYLWEQVQQADWGRNFKQFLTSSNKITV